MTHKQFIASMLISTCFVGLIIHLVKKRKLDIAYCWLWLFIGIGTMFVVIFYPVLVEVSWLMGSMTPTTTLFILAILVLLLICLQHTLVMSNQRRQIRQLVQEIALGGGATSTNIKLEDDIGSS